MTRKYGRGDELVNEHQWVWGAIDTTTHQVVIRRMGAASRDDPNLLALLAANVE